MKPNLQRGLSSPEIVFRGCSIADFLQELPATVKVAMPTLSMMFGDEVESRLGVRELQTAFVHSLVLGKKARVRFSAIRHAKARVRPRRCCFWLGGSRRDQ